MNDKPTITKRWSRNDPDYSFGGHQYHRAMDFTNTKGETLHVELPEAQVNGVSPSGLKASDDFFKDSGESPFLTADYSEIEKRAMAHYDDTPMPRKVGKHPALAMPYGTPDAPLYQRFVCMDGPLAGRGLIVQMPANRVLGYDLFKLEHGDHVAYVS